MPNNYILALHNIHYTYTGAHGPALKGAELTLTTDMRLGLLGHNGSGKTTLFHIATGLLLPQQGTVIHYPEGDSVQPSKSGTPLTTEKDFIPLRREVGYLFQQSDDQLFSPTVLEDVAFGPLNLGKSADEATEIALQTLELVGMEGFEERVTHKLSGGEKKMIALAAVLAMRPRLLLLDEPTNDLDPNTRDHLIDVLSGLDVAQCIISHDWDFMNRTCSQFAKLENGRIHEVAEAPHVHVHTHSGGDVAHRHDDPVA